MSTLPFVSVVRVFTDESGSYGNHLGIVLDTGDVDDEACQGAAHELGFSETVFVDDPSSGVPVVRLQQMRPLEIRFSSATGLSSHEPWRETRGE